ncbi:hypothetical protein ES703_06683 [subsurface metagenome]
MSIEQQKAIWDKNWQHQSQINLKEILNFSFCTRGISLS